MRPIVQKIVTGHTLGKNTPRYREDIMTIAEHLRQEGLQKGLQKGIQEGSSKREREIARNLLAIKMDRSVIEQVTGLSLVELDALMNSAVQVGN
jgi:predicted transposase/invertase (TIGR01784 family)